MGERVAGRLALVAGARDQLATADHDGADRYLAVQTSQGAGGPSGIGLLLDEAGAETAGRAGDAVRGDGDTLGAAVREALARLPAPAAPSRARGSAGRPPATARRSSTRPRAS